MTGALPTHGVDVLTLLVGSLEERNNNSICGARMFLLETIHLSVWLHLVCTGATII